MPFAANSIDSTALSSLLLSQATANIQLRQIMLKNPWIAQVVQAQQSIYQKAPVSFPQMQRRVVAPPSHPAAMSPGLMLHQLRRRGIVTWADPIVKEKEIARYLLPADFLLSGAQETTTNSNNFFSKTDPTQASAEEFTHTKTPEKNIPVKPEPIAIKAKPENAVLQHDKALKQAAPQDKAAPAAQIKEPASKTTPTQKAKPVETAFPAESGIQETKTDGKKAVPAEKKTAPAPTPVTDNIVPATSQSLPSLALAIDTSNAETPSGTIFSQFASAMILAYELKPRIEQQINAVEKLPDEAIPGITQISPDTSAAQLLAIFQRAAPTEGFTRESLFASAEGLPQAAPYSIAFADLAESTTSTPIVIIDYKLDPRVVYGSQRGFEMQSASNTSDQFPNRVNAPGESANADTDGGNEGDAQQQNAS